ncbi:MAG TPA: RNA polymerase sigma-70 factor [Arachidicoccus sp.]|nr:RNA polymerase sigma-70 factor [Arachidicoccus sp.]
MQKRNTYEDSIKNSEDVLEQLFNELFREYEHRLYVFALKTLKSETLAKDVVQDVFLKLWMIRNRISEIENIGSFLYRLTENKVIDYLRTAASDKKKQDALWQQVKNMNNDSTHPHQMLEAKEYHIIIQQAIEHLSPQRKSVYLLSKTEGRRRKEVATLLNISPNTVRNQLAKAVEHIVVYVKKHSG